MKAISSIESLSMVEEPFFFLNASYRLFCVLHHPSDDKSHHSETGIIFCDPFIEEKLWAHRVFVNLARFLAGNSYWVLRLDCMGHGDSEGNYEDSTVETQISDINRAVVVLKERTGVRRAVLLGARFGGTLAALAAAGNDQVHSIILWNPIVNGEKYFQECLRSNLTTQMTTYHKINYTREQMVKDLLRGEAVNIDGYLISPEFYKQITQIRLVEAMTSYNKPLLIIQIHKEEIVKIDKELQGFYETLREAEKPAEFNTVKGDPIWRELKIFPQGEDSLFNKTLEWIRIQEDRSVSYPLDSSLLRNSVNG